MLAEMRRKYPVELKELSWNTIYGRPDLQIRTMLFMVRDGYNFHLPTSASKLEALAFSDAEYNGGRRGLLAEKQACKLAGCDPSKWFNNVELYCMKSKVPLYGKRSACDINRHHVSDVIFTRAPKYKEFFK